MKSRLKQYKASLFARNIMIIVLAGLFLMFVFSGCIKSTKSKTIVIDDIEDNKEKSLESSTDETLDINKIYKHEAYKFVDNEAIRECLFAWYDNENIIGRVTRDKGDSYDESIESINYKYNFSRKIMDIEKYKNYIPKVSPDGTKIAYQMRDGINLNIFIKDLKTNEEKCIYEIESLGYERYTLWSNNSKYISFFKNDTPQNGQSIIIYDVETKKMREIVLEGWKDAYGYSTVKVSDDAKNAAVIVHDKNYKKDIRADLCLYNVELIKNKIKDKERVNIDYMSMSDVEFINKNKFVYIKGYKQAICIYDDNTRKTEEVMKNVDRFKISHDGKYIVYSKHSNQHGKNIYLGKISENKILNEKILYTGISPNTLSWSKDNRKILISGEKYSNGYTNSLYENIIIELK
ncbi:hypothetical protein [Clostridium ganghwense]|uniref:Lipoprotein n=1 Tax=Clostridium ganghwense TaxID=312089 RepID=A0ABT4CV76_9CLOT|nr:hypothetical protein [Clostridium ganghwense]MCY6372116.1 hypothetical protein [Clostridium ganghwense]